VRASWILPAWFLFPILMVAAEPEDPVYSIRTVAGGNNVGDGRAAVRAQLSDAQGVAVDAAGNVYIADADNHRVRKVSTDATIESHL
jgi:DNA-binding beta-propeller fold protein YncE